MDALLPIVVGLVSGLLSGLFGIGGAVVTTPAIRMLLGYPELIAVGTPLVVIIPTAVAGAFVHVRQGSADVRTGALVALAGVPASVGGAALTRVVGGSVVLMVTAVLIAYMAVDMLVLSVRGSRVAAEGAGVEEADPALASDREPARDPRPGLGRVVAIGLATGLYSGFLGLGGGFIVVPALVRWLGFPVKRAIGTSLVAVALLAVPGAISHYVLGNIDLALAGSLILGVVPGALAGARLVAVARERVLSTGFAVLLLVTGAALGLTEAGILG